MIGGSSSLEANDVRVLRIEELVRKIIWNYSSWSTSFLYRSPSVVSLPYRARHYLSWYILLEVLRRRGVREAKSAKPDPKWERGKQWPGREPGEADSYSGCRKEFYKYMFYECQTKLVCDECGEERTSFVLCRNVQKDCIYMWYSFAVPIYMTP